MSRKVRRILDDGGLKDVIILVSGGVDEDFIAKVVAAGSADRRLRRRRQSQLFDRRADARLRLQAAGISRQAEAQTVRRQSDVARPQAGVARASAQRAAWPAICLALENAPRERRVPDRSSHEVRRSVRSRADARRRSAAAQPRSWRACPNRCAASNRRVLIRSRFRRTLERSAARGHAPLGAVKRFLAPQFAAGECAHRRPSPRASPT